MKSPKLPLQCLAALLCLGVSGVLLAQAGQHDHQVDTAQPAPVAPAAAGHESHVAAPVPAAMDHSTHTMVEPGALRDPHAYSNGYTRTTGPYLLPPGQHLHLADEMAFSGLWIDRLEQVRHVDVDATELEGYVWRGNSYDKFLLNAEAELVNDSLEHAKIDLLWAHAVRPFWNLRLGATQEFGTGPDRSWATVGIRGLAPYWFEFESHLHLGASGRTAFELEAEYNLLLTQKLILQPRFEFKAYGKSDPAAGRGEGASSLESGVRLRYEFSRQFAPYIGVERVATFGETADLLPAEVDSKETHWIIGLRFWF